MTNGVQGGPRAFKETHGGQGAPMGTKGDQWGTRGEGPRVTNGAQGEVRGTEGDQGPLMRPRQANRGWQDASVASNTTKEVQGGPRGTEGDQRALKETEGDRGGPRPTGAQQGIESPR